MARFFVESMNRTNITLCAFCLSLLVVVPVYSIGSEPVHKTLFVIMDGIPADVIERVETPNLDSISSAGGYTRAYVGGAIGEVSESPTISSVGYQSLLTGTWANKHNVWDNQVDDPDYQYWDIFRIAKAHDASIRTALFSTWEDNRTKLIGDGKDEAGGFKLDHYVDGMEKDLARFPPEKYSPHIKNIDAFIAGEAADFLAAEGPDLTWVYMQYTDDIGHYFGDSPEQDEAVKFTDDLVGNLWRSVQARQASTGEEWLVIITTDHGRHASDGKGHGGQSDRERETWIVANRPCLDDSDKNVPAIVDILPSIVEHMNLEMPEQIKQNLDGTSFLSCP